MTTNLKLSERELKGLPELVAIATSTLYKADSESYAHRAELSEKTLRTAVDLGYKVFVVDGGSSDEFLRSIDVSGVTINLITEGTMGYQRRVAIRGAYDSEREIVAWTEPEKFPYIPELAKTVVPLRYDGADLTVASRTSLESYPSAQQYAEPIVNMVWEEVTGKRLDVWFGPRTWRKELSHYFLDYDGTKEPTKYGDRWDLLLIPVMNAIHDGKVVVGVEVNYTHPEEQKEKEEHDILFISKVVDQLHVAKNAIIQHGEHLKRN